MTKKKEYDSETIEMRVMYRQRTKNDSDIDFKYYNNQAKNDINFLTNRGNKKK